MAELLRVLRTIHRALRAQPIPNPFLLHRIEAMPGLLRLGYRLRPSPAPVHRRGAR
ncbi:hypothetical protein [Variovorax paradoxus]|uniref:hypothetical protein n=1 Tax=Variovorax paradoxus TaxID=34073 RepID=UPI002479FEEE